MKRPRVTKVIYEIEMPGMASYVVDYYPETGAAELSRFNYRSGINEYLHKQNGFEGTGFDAVAAADFLKAYLEANPSRKI